MNWEAWGPTLVGIATALIMLGSYRQRVKNSERRHDEFVAQVGERFSKVGSTLDAYGAQLSDHEKRLIRSEAWREGYAAGRQHLPPAK